MCPHLCACVSFFRLARASQTYLFPIHLTDQLLPSAVFYATAGPLLVYMVVHRLIIVPYTRAQKEESVRLDFTSRFNVTPRQHPLAAVVEHFNVSLSLCMQSCVRANLHLHQLKGIFQLCVEREKKNATLWHQCFFHPYCLHNGEPPE